MKIRTTLLILLWTTISGICFGQQVNDKIDYIAFRFSHSLRIPYSQVTIEIIKRQTETIVEVHSKPMNNDNEWKSSKIDKSFGIEEKIFIELTNEVLDLNKIDLKKALVGGVDGTECAIEFGTYGSTVTYKFWSPDYDTRKRELTDFMRLCKELIKIGGLDPSKVL